MSEGAERGSWRCANNPSSCRGTSAIDGYCWPCMVERLDHTVRRQFRLIERYGGHLATCLTGRNDESCDCGWWSVKQKMNVDDLEAEARSSTPPERRRRSVIPAWRRARDIARAALDGAAAVRAERDQLRGLVEWICEKSEMRLADGDFQGRGLFERLEGMGLLVEVPSTEEFRSEWGEHADTMHVLAWSPLAAKGGRDERDDE